MQTLHGGPFKIMTALVRAQPQTTFFEAAWIRAQVGAGEGKANALGGQCAGALAGLAHLRGFKGPGGVTKTKSSNIFLVTTKIRESTIFRFLQ